MRKIGTLSLALAVAFALVVTARAADEKEKKLEGTITCAKCDLKVDGQTKCHTVIKVKDGDKDVVYWFDADSSKKHHKAICTEAKKGTVKGTVTKKDDKMWIKVTELKFD